MSRISFCPVRAFTAVLAFNIAYSVPAANPPSAPSLEPVGLEVNWTGQAVLDPSRDKIRFITNDETLVFVQSTAGVVTALNAEVGRQMWVRQVGRNDAFSMQAVSNSDLLLIVSGPEAFGLDKFTGEEKFRYRLPHQPTAPPAIDSAAAYFPLGDGTVYGFSLQTLTHMARYDTLPPGVFRPYLWRFASNERLEHPPVATDNGVAFSSNSKNLHSVSTAGISYYQQFLNAEPSVPLALDLLGERRNIVIATEDRNLFSFDLTRGTLAWNVPLQRRVSRQPLIVGNRVYLVMNAVGITCVSTRTGNYVRVENNIGSTDRWFVPGIESIVCVASDFVYGVDTNHRIVAISQDTGLIHGRASMLDYSLHRQNSVTDRLYLASAGGELICLKPVGSDFATYHQRPEDEPLQVDVLDSDDSDTPEDSDQR